MPPLHPAHLTRSFSAAEALRSVFLSSAGQASRRSLPCSRPPLTPLITLRNKSQRPVDAVALLQEQEDQREAQRRVPAALRFAHPDRDEGIRARFVQVVDRRTNKLTQPVTLQKALQSIDRKTQFLVRVGGQTADATQPQLCKVLAKKDVFEQEDQKVKQAHEAKKRKKRREGKTLELGWNTAEGDLAYRFRKAETFLSKGDRVNFCFENRQKRTIVPVDKAQSLLDRVNEAMAQIPSVAEVDREGKLGGKMKVVYERAAAAEEEG